MFNSSEFWVAVLVVIVVLSALIRWFMFKATGKEISSGDSNLISSLRNKLVKTLITSNKLITLERTQGRDAVREEIAVRIRAYVEETDMFTNDEKALIEALDMKWLVTLIENELIKLSILKE